MKKKYTQFIIGIILSAIFLYISFRNVELKRVWETIRSINYWWAIPFLIINIISMYIRAMRWQILLEPAVKMSSREVFSPLMICFALNSILPFRAGEFARAYVIQKKKKVPFSSAFGTVVVERIYDMLTIIFLFALLLLFIDFDPSLELPYKFSFFGLKAKEFVLNSKLLISISRKISLLFLFALLVIVFFIIKRTRLFLMKLIRAMLWFLPEKPKEFLDNIIDKFALGFDSLKSPKKIFLTIFYSLLIWLSVGWAVQFMSYGFKELSISFLQANAIVIIICIAVALPSVPGYWGIYEVGCLFAILVLGITENRNYALSFSLIIHFGQVMVSVVFGMYFFFKEGLTFREVAK